MFTVFACVYVCVNENKCKCELTFARVRARVSSNVSEFVLTFVRASIRVYVCA